MRFGSWRAWTDQFWIFVSIWIQTVIGIGKSKPVWFPYHLCKWCFQTWSLEYGFDFHVHWLRRESTWCCHHLLWAKLTTISTSSRFPLVVGLWRKTDCCPIPVFVHLGWDCGSLWLHLEAQQFQDYQLLSFNGLESMFCPAFEPLF